MSRLEELYSNSDYDDNDISENNNQDSSIEDDNDYDYDEQKFINTFDQEVSAKSQSNIARECYNTIDINIPNPKDPNYRKIISKINPLDRFKYEVDKFAKELHETDKILFDVKDRDEMCLHASKLNNIKYLNPIAYVIGYWITDGGEKINIKKWKNINTIKNEVQIININLKDSNIYPADIIRYSRYWLNIKKNYTN